MIRLSLFLLIVAVGTLHIEHDQSSEIYNASNYYSELNSKQEKFISDIRNIKTQIDQLNQDLNSSTISKAQQLTKLQQGMADERDSLYNIETYLNTVSDIDPCRPCNLTDDQKTLMQNKIDKVRKSLQDLQSQVDFCPDCSQIQWIKQQIKKQYNYLQFIESALQSGCLKTPFKFTQEKPIGLVNIANSLYKDNLKAPNWVYGNLTQPQYKIYMFNRTSQYNLTSCPIDYPYVNYDQNNCMSCDGIFSLDTRKCQPCPSGQHYNLTLKKCVSSSIVCEPGTKLNPKTFVCEPILCAEGLKLDIKTNLCVSICTPSQVYNLTTKLCEQKVVPCKEGQHYNYTTQACEVCQQGKFYNLTTKLCEDKSTVCKQGQLYNATTKNCQNIVCNAGFLFNITSKKCEQIVCPSGQKFDSDSNKCIPKTTYSMCPPDKPYWNTTGSRCQQCPSIYPAFNADLDRCQACPTGTEWNQTSKVCEIHCPSGLILNFVSRKCQCPEGKIFSNTSNTCTTVCPTGQKLNPTTNICEIVCPTGQTLNPTTKVCQTQCPSGQTLNPLTKVCENQCPAGQIFNAATKICQTQCPSGQTLNPVTKVCDTQCQKGQIFNNVTKVCQNQCPTGQFYNQSIKQCQTACRPNSQWIISNQRCECIPGYISNTTDCIFKVINCSMPQPYWNPISKVCQNCPTERPNFSPSINECLQPCGVGSLWNNTLYKCVNVVCPPETPVLNFKTEKCEKCPENTVWSSAKKICESTTIDVRCPAGYSYNPKQQLCQMMVCPPGYHMNQVKNQCQKCPESYAYNETIGKCYKCPDGSTYNSTNQLCSLKVVCQSNQYFSQKQMQCKPILSCQFNQYFSIQTQSCVSYPTCKVDQVLNKNTRKCQPVPKCPSGSYYNQTTTQCDKINYVTSPNAPNLIYAYNISEYAKQYQNKKLSDPLMKDCQSNTPYFDQNSKYCVACPSSNPYFNLHTNFCQNCGELGYDEKTTRCKTNDATVDPTLERLIMNIL